MTQDASNRNNPGLTVNQIQRTHSKILVVQGVLYYPEVPNRKFLQFGGGGTVVIK